jgi:TctA family transporter
MAEKKEILDNSFFGGLRQGFCGFYPGVGGGGPEL